MHNKRMYIPDSIQDWIHSNYMHESRMIKILEKNLCWSNMQIRKYVKNCLDCAKNKKSAKQYAKLTLWVPEKNAFVQHFGNSANRKEEHVNSHLEHFS